SASGGGAGPPAGSSVVAIQSATALSTMVRAQTRAVLVVEEVSRRARSRTLSRRRGRSVTVGPPSQGSRCRRGDDRDVGHVCRPAEGRHWRLGVTGGRLPRIRPRPDPDPEVRARCLTVAGLHHGPKVPPRGRRRSRSNAYVAAGGGAPSH